MRISTAATASPPAWQILSQHRVRCDCPHRNTMWNHPVDWFGQIRRISREIAQFLRCEFCSTATIAKKGGNMAILDM
jgi:ribosomal protein S27E